MVESVVKIGVKLNCGLNVGRGANRVSRVVNYRNLAGATATVSAAPIGRNAGVAAGCNLDIGVLLKLRRLGSVGVSNAGCFNLMNLIKLNAGICVGK